MSNNNNLATNDEVLIFVKENIDKLPVCYLLLKPYKVSTYQARIAHNKNGEIHINLGTFYKPISLLLNESE